MENNCFNSANSVWPLIRTGDSSVYTESVITVVPPMAGVASKKGFALIATGLA